MSYTFLYITLSWTREPLLGSHRVLDPHSSPSPPGLPKELNGIPGCRFVEVSGGLIQRTESEVTRNVTWNYENRGYFTSVHFDLSKNCIIYGSYDIRVTHRIFSQTPFGSFRLSFLFTLLLLWMVLFFS